MRWSCVGLMVEIALYLALLAACVLLKALLHNVCIDIMSYITFNTSITIAFCTELTSNATNTDGSWVTSSGMMGHNWIRVTEPAKAATSPD